MSGIAALPFPGRLCDARVQVGGIELLEPPETAQVKLTVSENKLLGIELTVMETPLKGSLAAVEPCCAIGTRVDEVAGCPPTMIETA